MNKYSVYSTISLIEDQGINFSIECVMEKNNSDYFELFYLNRNNSRCQTLEEITRLDNLDLYESNMYEILFERFHESKDIVEYVGNNPEGSRVCLGIDETLSFQILWKTEACLDMGLCAGRHNIPNITEYVFYGELDLLDVELLEYQASLRLPTSGSLNLYVTGLTVALVAVLNVCRSNNVDVCLYHFNRVSGEYYPQKIY